MLASIVFDSDDLVSVVGKLPGVDGRTKLNGESILLEIVVQSMTLCIRMTTLLDLLLIVEKYSMVIEIFSCGGFGRKEVISVPEMPIYCFKTSQYCEMVKSTRNVNFLIVIFKFFFFYRIISTPETFSDILYDIFYTICVV